MNPNDNANLPIVSYKEQVDEAGYTCNTLPLPTENCCTDTVNIQGAVNDVQVLIGKNLFYCNSHILRNFCAIFDEGMKCGIAAELPENKITADIFELVYIWMLNVKPECTRAKLLDLLLAAKFLKVAKLEATIYASLADEQYYSNVSALICFSEANSKHLDDVVEMMLQRVGKVFLVIVNTEEYRLLEVYEIAKLLNSNHLAVQSETEVFFAAVFWILADFENRKTYTRYIFQSLRMDKLPPISALQFGSLLHQVLPDTVEQVSFRLYLAVRYSRTNNNSTNSNNSIRSRIYIKDPACSYYSILRHNRGVALNASMFKDYILLINDQYEEFLARIENLTDIDENNLNNNDDDGDMNIDDGNEADGEEEGSPALPDSDAADVQ